MVNRENLGPAERLIQTALTYADHMVHNRPGIVRTDPTSPFGVRWSMAKWKLEEGVKNVYELEAKPAGAARTQKRGKSTGSKATKVGVLQADGSILDGTRVVGRYQDAGLYPEVAAFLYRQVAEVWKLDNEFAAKWASYAYSQDHKDLKVVLAAFMLVQSRKGDPIIENGKVSFRDVDYRDIGEAMLLLYGKGIDALSPKLMVRVMDLLRLPQIQAINLELGFTHSTRNPPLLRWKKSIRKWLRFREENPLLLKGLVKSAYTSTVIRLAKHADFVPESEAFYRTLRWKQHQAKDGRRKVGLGMTLAAAESWEGLSEAAICQKIMTTKPSWKRITSMVPTVPGMTRAITAAAIEAGCLSNKDLIIATPTLEELGLLEVASVALRWTKALREADDMRAANIARNVKTESVKEALNDAADTALKTAVAEAMKALRIYVFVDISGSMQPCLKVAVQHLTRMLQGFPVDQLHVAVFNTMGREVTIPKASAAGVEAAFRGINAGGGTDYGSGVRALGHRRPKDDEDVLFIFIGDEQQDLNRGLFVDEVRRTGFNPTAFGFLRVVGSDGTMRRAVQNTAAELGVPCFMIDEKTFADPYAIPRTVKALVASTPVGVRNVVAARPPRETMIDVILKTELLKKPVWAEAIG